MKEKIKQALNAILTEKGLVGVGLTVILLLTFFLLIEISKTEVPDIPTEYTVHLIVSDQVQEDTEPKLDLLVNESEETEPSSDVSYTEEEIRMIAQLVMAEAGNQSELGKRLVIDVVLNRVDHPDPQYPDTVEAVIYQENQFSPISDGRFDKCYPTEENIQLVREEIERRTDHDVIFFRTTRYSDYGVPMYCVGDHYFSSFT